MIVSEIKLNGAGKIVETYENTSDAHIDIGCDPEGLERVGTDELEKVEVIVEPQDSSSKIGIFPERETGTFEGKCALHKLTRTICFEFFRKPTVFEDFTKDNWYPKLPVT